MAAFAGGYVDEQQAGSSYRAVADAVSTRRRVRP